MFKHYTAICPLSPAGRSREQKHTISCVGVRSREQGKHHLMGCGKGSQERENNSNDKGIYKVIDGQWNHSLPADWCPACLQVVPPPPASSLLCYHSARCHMVWDSPLVPWDLLSQLCPLTGPCEPPAHPLTGWDKTKSPWLGVDSVPQQQRCGVVKIIFILNQSHCTAADPRKTTVQSKLKTGQDCCEDLFDTLFLKKTF